MRINVNVEGIDALTSRLNKRIVRKTQADLQTALLYRARVATAFLSVRQPNTEYMLSSEQAQRVIVQSRTRPKRGGYILMSARADLYIQRVRHRSRF